jgi:hypothetical protein
MTTTTPDIQAEEFNARVQPGEWIRYREIKGEGPGKLYKTRSPAYVMSGHSAVVHLHGKSGCVHVSHCDRVGDQEAAAQEGIQQLAADAAKVEAKMTDAQPRATTAQAFYLLASVKHSSTGDPLVAWWRPEGRGYTISVAQAGTFTMTQALTTEYGSDSTVAIPLTDLGHRLEAGPDGDSYPFTGGNRELLETLLRISCECRGRKPCR